VYVLDGWLFTRRHLTLSFWLLQNGKYRVTPDTRRGQVQLIWSLGELKWEWMDRRDKQVLESIVISEGSGKLERVDTGREEERVYLWTQTRQMYWMQTLEKEGEDEVVAQVNQYLANPTEAAPEGEATTSSTGGSAAAAAAIAGGSATAAASSSSTDTSQVDALSNILENLGMPPEGSAPAAASAVTTTTSTTTPPTQSSSSGAQRGTGGGGGGTLTLADLQGAMAGLATTTPAPIATPLSEVVTPASITSLLLDDAVKNRLLEFLPEQQRSLEHLEENLRSPQVQQTLRSLTQALVPDEDGSLEGYNSVLANFQLDPKDGKAALASGNPVQAFLDCVLNSVEKEEKSKDDAPAKEDKNDTMEE